VCSFGSYHQVGTVPAALTTYAIIKHLAPVSLLINAGTAGGFRRKGAAIGDIFFGSRVTIHDRRIAIPAFALSNSGDYDLVPTPALCASLGLKTGVVSSSNSLDFTQQCAEIMLSNDASVKDMEASGIAYIGNLIVHFFYFCVNYDFDTLMYANNNPPMG
jgi:5'-methylthioadenosine nucleosidase